MKKTVDEFFAELNCWQMIGLWILQGLVCTGLLWLLIKLLGIDKLQEEL